MALISDDSGIFPPQTDDFPSASPEPRDFGESRGDSHPRPFSLKIVEQGEKFFAAELPDFSPLALNPLKLVPRVRLQEFLFVRDPTNALPPAGIRVGSLERGLKCNLTT